MKVVFGTQTFGVEGKEGVRTNDPEECRAILQLLKKRRYGELDSSRVYGDGTAEEMLGALQWRDLGFTIGTKLYPTKSTGLSMFSYQYTHEPEDVRRATMDSLKALKADKVGLLYLHGPDRTVPFEETLEEINELYKEGCFNRFGLSNFMSWEVAQICEICKMNGWIAPTVYQGIYNVVHRAIEQELIPCLRHYGISLYGFQPLAGGFLTDRYERGMKEDDYEPGSRFDPKTLQGMVIQGVYMNDSYLVALELIREAAKEHGLTEAECALRWIVHHSALSDKHGDAIVMGASSIRQLKSNLDDLGKGPLPETMLQVLDTAWTKTNSVASKYFH
ncbi:hypothetical protein TRICI_005386 [Trichomonascus ciferrii]|uniref:NADP-dependent oxidoreductase domain-containing protein n=1 Tax=Trichomonascus ciferrii TaxID=44093 RepID=A0A642USK4_9ASCO|nr:hypothetical protein TRICI_005386 [Trichomonascus ciferrii]